MPLTLDVFDDNKQVVVFLMYATPEFLRELVKSADTNSLRDIRQRIDSLTNERFRDRETTIGTAVVGRADRLSDALENEIRRRGNQR